MLFFASFAHFAAFGDATLTRFEPDFLLVPFEGRLIREALWPERLYRLTSPWFGRSQILAQRLDELFEGRTFGDVRRRPGAPELMITATDLTTGAPFDFTTEQLGQFLRNRQPQAIATVQGLRVVFGLGETLENLVLSLLGDANPRVLH